MNNARTEWQPLTREIVNFSKLFKRKFEFGDELNIDHVPGTGTQVFLNGTLFQTVKKAEFVNLLLNVWLGNNPPTKAFKKSIRGQDQQSVKDDLVAQYSAVNTVAGRFDADLVAATPRTVARPVTPKPEPPKAEVAAQTTQQPETTVADSSTPQEQEPAETIATNTNPDANNTTVNQSTEITENVTTPTVADNSSATSQESSTTGPENTDVSSEGTGNSLDETVVAQTTEQANTLIDDTNQDNAIQDNSSQEQAELLRTASLDQPETILPEEEEDYFDADLIKGSYTRDLLNFIRKHQKYPKKAFKNGEEGDVLVRVTIDSYGAILNIDIVERSGSRILDRAVAKMVRKAAPFEAIPTELQLEKFDFDVPISFKL